MLSLFGLGKAAAPLPCPVNPGHKIVAKPEDYARAFGCYATLKTGKTADARLNEIFALVDGTRTKWDALVETALRMNRAAADEYKAKLERDTDFAGRAIEGNPLLTREEKQTAHQFLHATMRQAERALREGRAEAVRAGRTAVRAEEAAGRAVAEREAAAGAAATALTATEVAAAAAGLGMGNATRNMSRIARSAARNAATATRRAERAEGRAGTIFERNAARRAGAASATNALLAAYAAPAAAPARAPVSGVRLAPTGAPSEYSGGRRKTRRGKKQRKSHKSRRAQRR